MLQYHFLDFDSVYTISIRCLLNFTISISLFDHLQSGVLFIVSVCLSLSDDNYRKPRCGKSEHRRLLYISKEYKSSSRTACVARKPKRWAQKRKMAVFRQKVHFFWRKSATQLLYANTVSDECIHWSILAKMVRVRSPYYVKIWPKLAYPFQNGDFL